MTRLVAKSATREAARKHGLKVVEQSETTVEQQAAPESEIEADRRRFRERLVILDAQIRSRVFWSAVPLALDIEEQLAEALLTPSNTEYGIDDLRRMLARWCAKTAYLRAIVDGHPRVGLDGVTAGFPTADDRAEAAQRLAEFGGAR